MSVYKSFAVRFKVILNLLTINETVPKMSVFGTHGAGTTSFGAQVPNCFVKKSTFSKFQAHNLS